MTREKALYFKTNQPLSQTRVRRNRYKQMPSGLPRIRAGLHDGAWSCQISTIECRRLQRGGDWIAQENDRRRGADCSTGARAGLGCRTERRRPVGMVGRAIRRTATVDRALSVAHAAVLASPLRQAGRSLGTGFPASLRSLLWHADRCGRGRACFPGRVHSFHHPDHIAIRGRRGHLRARQPAWHAGAQYRHSCHRHAAGQRHGHDRCGDADDTTDHTGQR